MLIVETEKAVEVFFFFRSAIDSEEIDYLNEEPRMALTFLANGFYESAESVYETIVAYAKKRPARNVAYARRLDDQSAGLSFGESRVPVEYVLSDQPIFGRAPRNHSRNPGAAFERERIYAHR
jgi:hypothetical protein